jgi:hypothetical protein
MRAVPGVVLHSLLVVLLPFLVVLGVASDARSAEAVDAHAWTRTARLVAGMATGDAEADGVEALPAWQEHRAVLDERWAEFETRQLAPMRAWSHAELDGRVAAEVDVLYPFSGPDAIHPLAIFPGRARYWMLSLEPVGSVPDLATLDPEVLEAFLAGVRSSLGSLLRWSFFRTRSLRADLRVPGLEGVLPLLVLFAARDGCELRDVHYLIAGEDGTFEEFAARPGGEPPTATGARVPGVRVRLRRPDGAESEILYFAVDLGSESLRIRRAFFERLTAHGPFTAYLKAASYLMFKPKYFAVRDYLLAHSGAILQDDSGIPWSFLAGEPWHTRLYGHYDEPIALFAHRKQEDLAEAFRRAVVGPLPFSAGYRHRRDQSNLILATRPAPAPSP